MEPKNDNNSAIPARRWTRPGFFQRIFQPGKNKDYFYFENLPESLSSLALNLDDIHLQWTDGYWTNLGTDYRAAITELNQEQQTAMVNENQDLYAKIEILLNLNTKYELEKARLREKLANLEYQIRHFPGLDLNSV